MMCHADTVSFTTDCNIGLFRLLILCTAQSIRFRHLKTDWFLFDLISTVSWHININFFYVWFDFQVAMPFVSPPIWSMLLQSTHNEWRRVGEILVLRNKPRTKQLLKRSAPSGLSQGNFGMMSYSQSRTQQFQFRMGAVSKINHTSFIHTSPVPGPKR